MNPQTAARITNLEITHFDEENSNVDAFTSLTTLFTHDLGWFCYVCPTSIAQNLHTLRLHGFCNCELPDNIALQDALKPCLNLRNLALIECIFDGEEVEELLAEGRGPQLTKLEMGVVWFPDHARAPDSGLSIHGSFEWERQLLKKVGNLCREVEEVAFQFLLVGRLDDEDEMDEENEEEGEEGGPEEEDDSTDGADKTDMDLDGGGCWGAGTRGVGH